MTQPTVGSVVTERGVCNSAEECKGVARAVVADQAALEARKKSKAAKGAAGNATAAAASKNNNNKARSKQLIKDEAEEEEEDVEARALGDAVDSLVGEGTGLLDDVTSTVGLKTRDGNEVRAAVTDNAALEARKKSKASKGAAGNATAAAASNNNNNNKGRSANLMDGVGASGTLEARKKNKKAKNATADAAAAADAGAAAARRSRRSYKLF